jgi:hypothetical protein
MKMNKPSIDESIIDLTRRIDSTLPTVQSVITELSATQASYQALATRVAHG